MGASSLSSRAIIGEFYATIEQGTGALWVPGVSALFNSNQESETYKWLGRAPAMREWVGGRAAKGVPENGVTNAHWAKLLSALIIAGESAACYDGQYFFDTDHAEGDSGSQSNDLTSDVTTTTAPSAAEMETAILKSVEAILGFKDDQGEPMNEEAMRFLVMVPTPFMAAAAAALKNPVIVDSNGSRTNTIASIGGFSFELAVNPRLTWTTKFATFRTDGQVKAFIRQEEEGVTVSAIAEGSELEFKENKHEYGVKAIRNVGYGYWQHACLTTLV